MSFHSKSIFSTCVILGHPVNEKDIDMGTSQDSSFVENEQDSDMFSREASEPFANTRNETKLENELKQTKRNDNYYENVISPEDKTAIIQDWLFQGRFV